MTWTTDEYGVRRFTYEGWCITVYPEMNRSVYIEAPDEPSTSIEVDIGDAGISVFGEIDCGYAGVTGARFTIPWPVVIEIVRIREEIVQMSQLT